MYPWPSFSSFLFKKRETVVFGTDQGWALAPSYVQGRPVGSTKDHIVATAIGSATRTFEIYLEQDRFIQLQALLNTVGLFTDWERPVPDSRQAFLTEVSPQEKAFHIDHEGFTKPVIRVRVSLLSQ
jgi:hypothetical protein